jgi:hypothetical protein
VFIYTYIIAFIGCVYNRYINKQCYNINMKKTTTAIPMTPKKFIKKHKKFLLIIFLIVSATLLAISLENLRKNVSRNPSYSISDVNYSVKDKNFFTQKINPKILKYLYKVKIEFDFKATGYNNYDNIFDTSGNHNGIRMEFNKSGGLGLVTHAGSLIAGTHIVNKKELEDGYHNVKIRIKDNQVEFNLDDHNVEINQPKAKIQFDYLNVGYGFSKDRFFTGKIKNFSIKYYSSRLLKILKILIPIYAVIAFIMLLTLVPSILKIFSIDFDKHKFKILFGLFFFFIIGSYVGKTLIAFNDYRVVSPDIKLNYKIFNFLLVNELKKDYKYLITKKNIQETNLPTFSIIIKREYLDNLNSSLPKSGKRKPYRGYLKIDDGEVFKIKMRYRGEGNFHWLYKQKSLRLKLKKGSLYNMERKFNLINGPYIHSFREVANYEMSKKLGIISPDCYPVKVFINGEYFGVYLYVSQANEGLLRKHKLMPGSVYYGDSGAPMTDRGVSDLWFNQKYWVKKASRSAEHKEFRDDIKLFLDNVNYSNEKEFYKFFNRFMNKEKFYNFIALDRVVGSGHHDMNHNHKIYFDPYKGKFEPIQWDVREWDDKVNSKDISNVPTVMRVDFNPILSYEADKATYNLYENSITDKLFNIYKENIIKSEKALKADMHKDTAIPVRDLFNGAKGAIWYSVPYEYKEQLSMMNKDYDVLKNRKKFLMDYYETTDIKIQVSEISPNIKQIRFIVGGNSPVLVDFSDFRKMYDIKRYFDEKHIPFNDEIEILYPGRVIVENKIATVPRGRTKVVSAYQEYVYIIDAPIDEINTSKISYKNAITGKKVIAKKGANFNINATSIHPWKIEMPQTKNIVLSGKIYVDKDIEYKNYQEITIKPGTTFVMGEGSSIVFFGKVNAIGTEDNHIKFVAKDINKPWGSVIVQGQSTNGSEFKFVDFDSGSLATKNLINYTGQFNIHDSNNFIIENCTFKNNKIGDDNLHIAYSKGILSNSLFYNSGFDAIDVDISDIVIKNNVFYKSGNDGIDLMTTEAKILQNIISKSEDKGISVGEWSNATIDGNILYKNNIGVAVKDKSRVEIKNSLFIKSKTTMLDAYNKNWRYDEGGFISGDNILVIGNDKIKSDKISKIDVKTKKTKRVPRAFLWYKNLYQIPADIMD